MALARMLVIVSTIFIVTASPIVALSIARSMVYDFFIDRRYTNIFLLCHTIYLELGMVNSSGINFIVYVVRSSRFRQELATFACFRFLKRQRAELKKEGVTVNTETTGASAVSSSKSTSAESLSQVRKTLGGHVSESFVTKVTKRVKLGALPARFVTGTFCHYVVTKRAPKVHSLHVLSLLR